jgi:hypothetical protein
LHSSQETTIGRTGFVHSKPTRTHRSTFGPQLAEFATVVLFEMADDVSDREKVEPARS